MPQRLLFNLDELYMVRNIPLFAGLAEEEKDALFTGSYICSYASKEYLYKEGDTVRFLYILCGGIVQEFRATSDGREITANIYKPEDVFCKASMFQQGGAHHTNTRAIKNVYVMELPVKKFKESLHKYESITRSLFSSLAHLAVMQQIEMEQRTSMKIPQILALFLKNICDSYNLDPHGFILPYSKSLMASRLGIELETLSRALPKLKEYGIVVEGSYVRFTHLSTTAQHRTS